MPGKDRSIAVEARAMTERIDARREAVPGWSQSTISSSAGGFLCVV